MKKTPEPIYALFAKDATHLIGKRVLCAQEKEGLGYWATLVRIEESSTPFICVLNNPQNTKKTETKWRWVVEDAI